MLLDSSKKIHRFCGWIRSIVGFCPRCNCDAPHCDNCPICRYIYTPNLGSELISVKERNQCTFPWGRVTSRIWYEQWLLMKSDYIKEFPKIDTKTEIIDILRHVESELNVAAEYLEHHGDNYVAENKYKAAGKCARLSKRLRQRPFGRYT